MAQFSERQEKLRLARWISRAARTRDFDVFTASAEEIALVEGYRHGLHTKNALPPKYRARDRTYVRNGRPVR